MIPHVRTVRSAAGNSRPYRDTPFRFNELHRLFRSFFAPQSNIGAEHYSVLTLNVNLGVHVWCKN